MTKQRWFLARLVLIFIALFIVSFFIQKYSNINLDKIQAYILSFGPLAPLIYAAVLFLGLTIPFDPIPDYAVVLAAAFIFPPPVAILATFAAHSFTLIVNYLVGNKYGWRMLDIFYKQSEMDFGHKIAKRITPGQVFALRWVLPLTAIGIDIVSYAAGMAKMNFAKYMIASLIPWTTVSIIFFTSTNYLRGISPAYVFIPTVIMIGVSLILYKFLNSKVRN